MGVPLSRLASLATGVGRMNRGDKATYIGHEFEACKDFASLHYRLPIEKGYVVDWDAQKAIWDGVFSDQVFNIDTTEASILITEPYFNLPNIQEVYDQFVFEEYEFQSYYRCSPAALIPYGTLFSQPTLSLPECMIVVDSGFSFTHVVPIMEELVSFRQWNMMDETHIMNHVKETCCLVSANFKLDLEVCRADPKRNSIIREYILPDLSRNKQGRVRKPDDIVSDEDQVLAMNNERFVVPELIFRPDDIGLEQAGLPETIAHCISLLPEDLQGMFWSNIGLIGGNTKFPGFRQRLQQELRALAPVEWEVAIYEADDPITEAYKSAYEFASRPGFTQQVITRAEYAESGSNASRRKFPSWQTQEIEKDKGKQREDDRPQASSRTRSKVASGSTSVRNRR
ncbi:hypothetical protein EST38_g470 [Candolleomyces aberdarensis]|uniref:Actin-like protein ARP6 n=1 Tax=Candolleomyces aberdarensis TaxID=2316362 RepID=A0A4V1Q5E8_9AGAR|nr:hypothetical protein EST38_g470 [Candolleomyces aberdarensis]